MDLYGAAFVFIIGKLKANSPLAAVVAGRIYAHRIPQNTSTYPVVTVGPYGGVVLRGVGADVILGEEVTLTIKGIASGKSMETAYNVSTLIQAALVGGRGYVTIGEERAYAQGCEKMTSLNYVESDAGVDYYHVGGTYRLYLERSPI